MPNTIAENRDSLPVLIHVVTTKLLDPATWFVAAHSEAGEITDLLQTSSGSVEGALVVLAGVFLFLPTVIGQFRVALVVDVFFIFVVFLLKSGIKVFPLLHVEIRKIAFLSLMLALIVLVWYL